MNEDKIIHIVVTGPESTGKSELSKWLSENFEGEWVNEYARTYLQQKKVYQLEDLKKIAFGQFSSLLSAKNSQKAIIFSDTCLMNIIIWSDYKFGYIDPFIEEWYGLQEVDFYLLCRPDIPWKADPLRENEHNREELFALHQLAIEKSGVPYRTIYGEGMTRFNLAKKEVKLFLENRKKENTNR
jgi:nicotinamide riboside kinase